MRTVVPSRTPRATDSVRRLTHVAAACLMMVSTRGSAAEPPPNLDPAAWGSDHVGKALPEFISGDECLFCHRIKIGPTWTQNRHQSTLRQIDLEPADLAALKESAENESITKLIEFVLGRTNQMRFLKRSETYGKLDLLSTRFNPGQPKTTQLLGESKPHWETDTFANQCAGCHAAGMNSQTRAFSAISLDCFSCHGDVDLGHSKDPTQALLAGKRHDPARVVVSICGSCHIRTGRSRSTGLSFPNNFVPGDNLFRDLEVDFSNEALGKLNAIDRHVLQNVRDVVLRGEEKLTCLTCHSIHQRSSLRHRRLRAGEYCWNCHDGHVNKLLPDWSEVHSKVCGY